MSFSCLRASNSELLFQAPEAELTVSSSKVRELSRLMLLWSLLSLLLLADLSPLFLAGEEATAALLKCCTSLYRSPGNPLLGSVLDNSSFIGANDILGRVPLLASETV